MRTILKYIISSALILYMISPVLSHPHVFIDYTSTFHFNKNKLTGIQVTWIFDEMFSSSVINDYDKNKNAGFDIPETKKLKKDVFENLKTYDYFCHININKKMYRVKKVKYFSPSILNKTRLVYSFFIPVDKMIGSGTKINFAVYDTTYYCSTLIKDKNGFAAKGIPDKNYSMKITKNHRNKYYNNMIIPEEITLKYGLH